MVVAMFSELVSVGGSQECVQECLLVGVKNVFKRKLCLKGRESAANKIGAVAWRLAFCFSSFSLHFKNVPETTSLGSCDAGCFSQKSFFQAFTSL